MNDQLRDLQRRVIEWHEDRYKELPEEVAGFLNEIMDSDYSSVEVKHGELWSRFGDNGDGTLYEEIIYIADHDSIGWDYWNNFGNFVSNSSIGPFSMSRQELVSEFKKIENTQCNKCSHEWTNHYLDECKDCTECDGFVREKVEK